MSLWSHLCQCESSKIVIIFSFHIFSIHFNSINLSYFVLFCPFLLLPSFLSISSFLSSPVLSYSLFFSPYRCPLTYFFLLHYRSCCFEDLGSAFSRTSQLLKMKKMFRQNQFFHESARRIKLTYSYYEVTEWIERTQRIKCNRLTYLAHDLSYFI